VGGGVWLGLNKVGESEIARCGLAAAIVALIGFVIARFQLPEPVSLANSIVRPFATGVREVLRRRLAWSALIGSFVWFFVTLTVFVALVRLPPAEITDGVRDLTVRFAIGLGIGILRALL